MGGLMDDHAFHAAMGLQGPGILTEQHDGHKRRQGEYAQAGWYHSSSCEVQRSCCRPGSTGPDCVNHGERLIRPRKADGFLRAMPCSAGLHCPLYCRIDTRGTMRTRKTEIDNNISIFIYYLQRAATPRHNHRRLLPATGLKQCNIFIAASGNGRRSWCWGWRRLCGDDRCSL